jgi:hypothetical protein
MPKATSIQLLLLLPMKKLSLLALREVSPGDAEQQCEISDEDAEEKCRGHQGSDNVV